MRGFKAFYGAPQSNLVKVMKSLFAVAVGHIFGEGFVWRFIFLNRRSYVAPYQKI